jgi:hypothetical protein
MREVVREALQFERRPAASDETMSKQGLQRNNDLLPAHIASGLAIDTSRRLFEQARAHIVAAQCGRIASIREPC